MENIKLCHTPLGNFYVLTNDRWIGKTLLSGNAWEEPLIRFLKKYVKEGTTVVGVPAKEVGKSGKASPAGEVDHNIYKN